MGWEGGKTTCAESATLSHDATKRSDAWAFPPSRSGTLAIILSADVSKSSRCSTVVRCGGGGRACVGGTAYAQHRGTHVRGHNAAL